MTSAVQTPLAQGETSSARRVMDGTLRVPRLMGSRAHVVARRAARDGNLRRTGYRPSGIYSLFS
jgi:hypothetical protein